MNNSDDFYLCDIQGSLFSYAVEEGYDLKTFSDVYLKSEFCRRKMDSEYSIYQSAHYTWVAANLFPEIESDLKKIPKEEMNKDYVFAEDVGFMYRLLYILTSVPSRELADIVPFDYLLKFANRFQHYGFEHCAYDIIEHFSLPERRYDTDFKVLTDEEAQAIMKEYEENERKTLMEYSDHS